MEDHRRFLIKMMSVGYVRIYLLLKDTSRAPVALSMPTAWTKLVHSACAYVRFCSPSPRAGCLKACAPVTFKNTGAHKRSCFPS
jgi:hypothetical protein